MTEKVGHNYKAYLKDGEYEFLVVRHEKFDWLKEDNKYIYFLYITEKQVKSNAIGEKKILNILCHMQMYLNYHYLIESAQSVLEEYILEEEKILEFMSIVTKLALNEFELEVKDIIAKRESSEE